MEHPMCKRRGVRGEGQPGTISRLSGFTGEGVVGRLFLCFFCNHFLICSRGVFVCLFLRVPRRFGVHFGVVLASFLLIFLNKSTFENMCFVYTKPYFFRSGWVGCLNFFLRISSMLLKIYFLHVFGVLVTAQGQFWDPIGSLLGVSGPILASLWTPWSPLCSGVGIRRPKEQFWWSLEGFTRWFTRNHLVNVVWIAFTRGLSSIAL